jgi:hypothetical protein
MSKIFICLSILVLMALLLSSCTGLKASVEPGKSPQPATQATATETTAVPAADMKAFEPCPVTAPVIEHPTDTDVFGDGPEAEWYCDPDNRLCAVKNGAWHAGGIKVGWRKPPGARFDVSGRRLDAEAPPLKATIPDGYPGTFQASGLTFPTEGCWEVEARTDENTLRFVVQVEPPLHPPTGGRCDDLAAAVQSSDAIIWGLVEQSELDPRGYAWQTVRVLQLWKNPFAPDGDLGESIEVLQDTNREVPLQTGRTYLLFLQYEPWQVFCPERTLAEVVGGFVDGEVIGLSQGAEDKSLWSGHTPMDVWAEIKAILSPPTDVASAPPGLVLVTQDNEGYGLQGLPFDPGSLADLPGYEPIGFGHHYQYAISPDGRTLATMTWPSGMHNRDGVLHLIDLPSWTEHSTGVTLDDYVNDLVFSPDGKALYWTQPTQRDPAHGLPRDYQLYRYAVGRRKLTVVTGFPSSFSPGEMHLLRSGSRLAIYGVPTDANYLADDVPRVLLVDLVAGHLVADVRLDGVTAGQIQLETAGPDEPPYRFYLPGLAWDLEHDLLYVVHADTDEITVVDLAQGEISRQATVHPRYTLLERLGNWLVPVAAAKGSVPGTEKRAVLSPDGTRLYVAGLRSEMTRREDDQEWIWHEVPSGLQIGSGQRHRVKRTGEWIWHEVPLGLQVIATGDLAELGRVDLAVSDLALSPDGRWLLLASTQEVTQADGGIEHVGRGLYLFDAQQLQEVAHLAPEVEFRLNGFSPDGRYAYVSTSASDWQGDRYGNWRVTLHVLDLETGRFVAEREFIGYVLDVITPAVVPGER